MKVKVLFLFPFFFTSCYTIVKVAYGVKTPRPRKTVYIQKSAKKHGLINFEHYSISESGFINLIKKKNVEGVKNTINQVLIFNEKGNLMIPKEVDTCSGQIINFIGYYSDTSKFKILNNVYFQTIFGDSVSRLDDENTYFSPPKDKILFVLTWASYVGKLNTNSTSQWADSIHKTSNINAVFLNLDIRESWSFWKD